MASSHDRGKIRVRTTLPALPPRAEREPIRTARLVLRPFAQDDLEGLHALRAQPEVMIFTGQGRPDVDLAETQTRMDRFLPPHDAANFNCVVCLAATGELVGVGGVHRLDSPGGWPEVGYMFKHEHWGKGYGTEFMRAFLDAWWSLPREDAEIEVDPASLEGRARAQDGQAPEILTAIVEANNRGSLHIVDKLSFQRYKDWTEPDSRAGFEGIDACLVAFALEREAR
jgi:RimJ/RimL family protein N-acetyltransferase